MKLAKKQEGVTALGWLIILGLIAFFSLVTLKVFPLYYESLRVTAGMRAVAERPDIATLTTKEIENYLTRNLEVSDVKQFNERNIRNYLTITTIKDTKRRKMTMKYESRNDLFWNLAIVLKFDKTIDLPSN
ncbi:MAG: DUF4845 domain-containing protein [Gammaproteobacteria bacterium]|nr:DUF4845 domain-containing protein [Gammaproteobacteria bacterium]MCI0590946.1 DUF4845 domain-containing protein [Gammaproteobacteria bacterium]